MIVLISCCHSNHCQIIQISVMLVWFRITIFSQFAVWHCYSCFKGAGKIVFQFFCLRSLFCSLRDCVSLHSCSTHSFRKLGYCVSVFFVLSVCSMSWIQYYLKRLKNIWLVIQMVFFNILFSLYKNNLLKYNNCVIKNVPPKGV